MAFARIGVAAGVALLAAMLLWQVQDIADWGAGLAPWRAYPYGADYGEGVVWQQALTLLDGTAYGPIHHLPATPFNYPPLFHLLALGGAWLTGADLLRVGRTISMVATLVSAAAAGLLVRHVVAGFAGRAGRLAALAGVLAGGMLPISEMPALQWSAMMRVDSLAVALGMLGLLVGVRAPVSPAARRGAMALFVLAVFTKQTMITAPLAFLAALAWWDWRAAWRALGFGVLLGLGPLLVLLVWSDLRVFTHLITINYSNRFEAGNALRLLMGMRYAIASGTVSAVVIAACLVLRRPARADLARADRFALVLACLNALTMTVHLGALGKSGAAHNYTLGPLIAVCPLVGIAVAWAAREAWRAGAGLRVLALPLLCLAMIGQFWRSPPFPGVPAARGAAERDVVARLRGVAGPVLSEDPALLLRAGRRYDFEPAMMTELASTGWWNEAAFVESLRRHHYALLVLEGGEGDSLFDARFTPAMRAAMRDAYACAERIGPYRLCRPDA